MKKSPQINELSKALTLVQGKIEDAKTDSTNPHFKSRYPSLASVYASCRKLLSEHGIAIVQSPSVTEKGEVRITTLMAHVSDQFIEDSFDLMPKDKSPQAYGSAVSYGRRYALMAMIGIASDDDDGSSASTPYDHSTTQPVSANKNYSQGVSHQKQSVAIKTNPSEFSGDRGYVVTDRQLKRLYAIQMEQGWAKAEVSQYIEKAFNKKSSTELTKGEYDVLCEAIETNNFNAAIQILGGPKTKEPIREMPKAITEEDVPAWVTESQDEFL